MSDKVNPNRRNDNRPNKPVVRNNSVPLGNRLATPSGKSKPSFQSILDSASENLPYGDHGMPGDMPLATQEAIKPTIEQNQDQHDSGDHGKGKEFQSRMREKEREYDASDESKTSKSAGATESTHAKVAEKKVVSRESFSDQKHQGQQEGGQGDHKGQGSGGQGGFSQSGGGRGQGGSSSSSFGSGGSFGGKSLKDSKGVHATGSSIETGAKKSAFSMEGVAPLPHSMTLKSSTPQIEAKPQARQVMNKALLDQIAQYVRLVTKTDGDKEMEMDLNDEVFKGLKIRVALSQGKIETTFLTRSNEVMQLFQAHASDLRKELAEKGIQVAAIHVKRA